MERLDDYTELPSGMKEYLSYYGWHFSKKMYEFAVKGMKDRNNNMMNVYDKQYVDNTLKSNNISFTYKGYDAPYVYAMAKSDFFGSALQSENQICRFVKDYIDDVDGYEGIAFTRFYADCMAKGIPIIWEDLL